MNQESKPSLPALAADPNAICDACGACALGAMKLCLRCSSEKGSFSFGRALQARALNLWKGRSSNITAAQRALHHRVLCNSRALGRAYSCEAGAT